MAEETLKRIEESSRRNLEAVTPYVDASQLAVLRGQMEMRISMAQTRLRSQAERERQQQQPSQ